MERIMSKSNDTSNVVTLESMLVDTELAGVAGGMIPGLGAIYPQMVSDTISASVEGAVRSAGLPKGK
jgi:hypothetical protein